MTIRYDPRDLAEIRVYHQGASLCRAVAPEIAAATVSMKDLQAARNQRRRELRQHLTARRGLVDNGDRLPGSRTRRPLDPDVAEDEELRESRGRLIVDAYVGW